MKENFDCTQFITFDLEDINIDIQQIITPFKDIGFEVILMNEIRDVKKEYFRDYIRSNILELKCDDFIGEFEDWEVLDKPPLQISQFANVIRNLTRKEEISSLKIFLTSFAEEGYSSNEIIKTKIEKIEEALFAMSKHYYDVWTDNLIIEII